MSELQDKVAVVLGASAEDGGMHLRRMPRLDELPSGADSYGEGLPLGDRS